MNENGWLDRRAAEGQREAFKEALYCKDVHETPPFLGLCKAMEHIGKVRGFFLDVGCGAGGYAALVDRLWPHLTYRGCDISPHMIEFAREDYGDRFFVCDAMDLVAEPEPEPDIILASSLIEVCPDWQAVLCHLLGLPFRWMILNRVRVWNDPEHPATERWYINGYGIDCFEVTHNWPELTNLIARGGGMLRFSHAYQVEPDTALLTMVVVNEDTHRS